MTKQEQAKVAEALGAELSDAWKPANLEEALGIVDDAAAGMLGDVFAACALVGMDCRGQEPGIVAQRCYEMSAAMLKRRAELLPPAPLPKAATSPDAKGKK